MVQFSKVCIGFLPENVNLAHQTKPGRDGKYLRPTAWIRLKQILELPAASFPTIQQWEQFLSNIPPKDRSNPQTPFATVLEDVFGYAGLWPPRSRADINAWIEESLEGVLPILSTIDPEIMRRNSVT